LGQVGFLKGGLGGFKSGLESICTLETVLGLLQARDL